MFKKAACFTDIHFGLKNNSRQHNNDCETFVKWFIDEAKKFGAETCIFLGDWHHHRSSINISTLNYSISNLKRLSENFEKTYFITGNHDLFYRDKREISSVIFANEIPNIEVVNEILVKDDVAVIPWLVGNEWKKIKKIKCKYMFGHFELPNFKMNAMVEMPDHGEIQAEHFSHIERVFSGHFHKRQVQGKIHYLGNAFPHNYADAWDDKRGMMILDKENNKEPVYIDWDDCPKYRTLKLSKLLDEKDKLLKSKMYLRVTLDLPISYEEASFIKETFVNDYDCREITLIPSQKDEEIHTDIDISTFESVDQIVTKEITAIDTEQYDKNTLLRIYDEL